MKTLLPVEFQFTSDGTTTAMIVDLTAQPIRLNFAGGLPVGVIAVTVIGPAPVQNVTAAVSGQLLTLTFAAPLPSIQNGATIVWTAQMLLQLATVPASESAGPGFAEGGFGQ
jgi:hypothetical protein